MRSAVIRGLCALACALAFHALLLTGATHFGWLAPNDAALPELDLTSVDLSFSDTPDGTRRRCSLESALLAIHRSGVRVFSGGSRYPARADPEYFTNGSGPDGFRCIAPLGASIPESADSVTNLSPRHKEPSGEISRVRSKRNGSEPDGAVDR